MIYIAHITNDFSCVRRGAAALERVQPKKRGNIISQSMVYRCAISVSPSGGRFIV